jgi:DUF4097 and DUF4098 domain-containing protein YvlB
MKTTHASSVKSLQLATVLCLAALSATAATEDRLEKTFSVGPGGKLVVEANVGSIEVTTSDRKDVHIEVTRSAEARGLLGGGNAEERETKELKANKVDFNQDGQTVIVHAERDKEADRNSRVNLKVRYVVSIPSQFAADLKTAGGGITVAGLNGELKAKTSGGSLKFAEITGPIDGRTSGGSISLTKSTGESTLKTSGGSIKVLDHKGDLTARTSGGSITVERVEGNVQASTSGGSVNALLTKAPTADVRLETSGGGITVGLPEGTAAELDAQTSGGSVHSDLPLTSVEHKSRSALRGKINNGGAKVQLRTSGGSIHVKKA